MLNEDKLKQLLQDYVPKIRVETYYGKGPDPVQIEEHWNVNTSEWDTDPENAKRGFLLKKVKAKLNKFLKENG